MSLTLAEKKENNIYELEIAVGAEELKAATDRVFTRKVKDINVPGFRKGKAPRKIIEKMYGEGVFIEDAVNELYPGAYDAAVEEAGIEPVSRADVEILNLDIKEGFTFKATVTVKPEITLKAYKGLEAEKTLYPITEHDIDHEIDRFREQGARIVTVEGRAAKSGDTVIIDFEGFIDEVPFEGGKAEEYELILGSNSFIDNFEDQIAGHNAGDEFDVNVSFPENYHSEELKGKPALFKIKLREIKEKELPELDDEFAKDVSEFDTLEALRGDLKSKRREQLDKRSAEEFENKLVDKVIEGIEGDIPEVMYENRSDELMREFEYRLTSQGLSMDLYLNYSGMDADSFRKTFREQAVTQVKTRLALEKIAELEGLEPTAEEIAAEYEKAAELYKMDVDRVKGMIAEKVIKADLASGKAIDIIKESSKAIEVEAPPEEHDHFHEHYDGHDHEHDHDHDHNE